MEKIAKLPRLYVEFVREGFDEKTFAGFVVAVTYAFAPLALCMGWLLFIGGQFGFAWVITAPFIIPAPLWMIHLIQFAPWAMERADG